MDNKLLLFDANVAVPLPQPLRFSISQKTYEQIRDTQEKSGALAQLSASKTLICTNHVDNAGENVYSFFTPNGKFVCKHSPENGKNPAAMFAMAFDPMPSFGEQNDALTKGQVFFVPEGIVVRVKLNAYQEYFCLRDGQLFEADYFDYEDIFQSITTIIEAMGVETAPLPEPPSLSEGLTEMLDIAEQYAKLENEIEEARVQTAGSLSYTAIYGAENESDRTAVTLVVGDFDDTVYKERAQVIITDKRQKEHTAEVKQAVKSKDGSDGTIELLFKEQLDFQQFEQQGFITPSFNEINMTVQLKAIDNIRNGDSPAASYMNDIFDDRGFGAFEKKDMSAVDEAIRSLKNPPNASQINAIKAGINTKNVFLVMGPPGTGKTTVILEWIKHFVKREHLRVLVSSQNNKAVDNVLERIKEEPDIDMIRIGTELRVDPGIREFLFDKKVKKLRESIRSATTRKVEELRHQWHAWNEIFPIAQQFQLAMEQKKKAWDALYQKVMSDLIPMYQSICQIYDAYNANAMHIAESKMQIQEESIKLEALKQKSAGLWKAVYWLPIFLHRRKLNRLFDTFAQLRLEEEKLIGEYNLEYLRYAEHKELLRGELYRRFFSERASALTIEEELKTQLSQPLDDSFGLFAGLKKNIEHTFQEMAQNKEMVPCWQSPGFCIALQSELERCKNIIELVQEWHQEVLERQNYSLQNIVLESVNLVGATCIGVSSQRRFDGLKFDVTIIDEAGQIQIHKALVPMSVSRKLIMLGDHKQIPPTADQEMIDSCKDHEISAEFLSKSLFETMYESFPESNKIMLDTQYRMPGEIADTLSHAFYDGKYLSWQGKRMLRSVLPFLSEKPYIVIDTSEAGNNRYEQKLQEGCRNNLEAELIETIVKKMVQCGQDMDEVGIISAYKKQVEAIAKRLRPLLGEKAAVVAATLDSFQGQERDVIIYSFTRSSQKPSHMRRIGFLNELRRLNVAMSRPKKTLVMIGDMPFLQTCTYMPPAEDEDENDEQERYQRSEKRFGAFIGKMIADVKANGDYIPYNEFLRRMKG